LEKHVVDLYRVALHALQYNRLVGGLRVGFLMLSRTDDQAKAQGITASRHHGIEVKKSHGLTDRLGPRPCGRH
jgi:hypothetical protein